MLYIKYYLYIKYDLLTPSLASWAYVEGTRRTFDSVQTITGI